MKSSLNRGSYIIWLLLAAVFLWWTAKPVSAQIMSEADTCRLNNMTVGFRNDLMALCYATVSNSLTNTNGVACTISLCCCVDSTIKPRCLEPGVIFTPAVPSTTSVTPSNDVKTKTMTETVESDIEFTPELGIPGLLEAGQVITVSSTTMVEYIRYIFIYFIWIVGIIAVVMVIYGGVRWIAAAGNAGQINEARSIINNAIIGVIIALTSVVLLNIINPNLTSFNGLSLKYVDKETMPVDSDNQPGKFSEGTNEACLTKSSRQPIKQESTCFLGSQSFIWPIDSPIHRITSPIGLRDLKVGSKCHPGTDFGTEGTSKPIIAPHAGTIRAIGSGCGEIIFELAADTFYTRYVHVKRLVVTNGQTVSAGTVLGYSGGDPKTSAAVKKCSGGPHVHIELYSNDNDIHDIEPCIKGQ